MFREKVPSASLPVQKQH